jgi:hypothetical protein
MIFHAHTGIQYDAEIRQEAVGKGGVEGNQPPFRIQ